jgi:Crp-like helix-turn-helix protein
VRTLRERLCPERRAEYAAAVSTVSLAKGATFSREGDMCPHIALVGRGDIRRLVELHRNRTIRPTHDDLAAELGTAREVVSRLLKEFRTRWGAAAGARSHHGRRSVHAGECRIIHQHLCERLNIGPTILCKEFEDYPVFDPFGTRPDAPMRIGHRWRVLPQAARRRVSEVSAPSSR